jgi:hypothetical protein
MIRGPKIRCTKQEDTDHDCGVEEVKTKEAKGKQQIEEQTAESID